MKSKPSRREFLGAVSLSAGMSALGGVFTGAARQTGRPGDKLNIACIGVGGQGASDLHEVSGENIVALCDVDTVRAADSLKLYPNVPKYTDYRKMLEQKNIEAVTVTTPDHHHAPAAILAMTMGKHVYCQKPLAHTVYEATRMMDVARRHKVATQMGIQGHPDYVATVEMLRAGAIGPVREVHVWTNRPIWPQGMPAPTVTHPVPATLDWNLWLGPARARPYSPEYLPFIWRGWWDFGTGALGDMACHLMDPAFWALKLGQPTSVEAQGEPIQPDSGPRWSIIRWEFPAREDMPASSLTWYDGGKRPSDELLEGEKVSSDFNGSLFIGDAGKLLAQHGGPARLLPAARFQDYKPPAPYLPRSPGHYLEWIQAAKTDLRTSADFAYSGNMTEAILLGNVALRTGKKIDWDSTRLRATSCPEADPFLRPYLRHGWRV